MPVDLPVLVTGATGKSGAAVVRQLLSEGRPVRALVRRQDERADALRRQGADVVVGHLQDTEALQVALKGVGAAYYVPPFSADTVRAAVSFAAAARHSELKVLVQMSQWLSSPRHPALMTRDTWLTDQLMGLLPGVTHVRLIPGMFADNFLRTLDLAVFLGVFPVLTGESACAPVSNEDLARAACAVLHDPQRHAGRTLRPTGPALLTGQDMARVIARVLQRPVAPLPTPFWLFNRAARASGASIHEVLSYRDYMRDHRGGAFSLGGGVTKVLEDLTGSPAEPFEVTVRRYLQQPALQPTPARRLATLVQFLAMPFKPGFPLRRYEAGLAIDGSGRRQYGFEDTLWQAERLPDVPPGTGVNASVEAAMRRSEQHARA